MGWILEACREKTNDSFSISSCAKNLFTKADFLHRSLKVFLSCAPALT
jgi:hypothetical protein